MATRKRTPSRSRLNQAVRVGRSALKEAERRLPPDVRHRIGKAIKDGQKRFDATVKDISARVNKAAGQGDLDRAMKRFDELVKQARKMAGDAAAAARAARRGASTTAARSAPIRKTATRKPATRKAAARKPAARKPAARKATAAATPARKPAARKAAPRKRAPAASAPLPEPTIRYVPPSVQEAPGPVPERVEGT